MADTPKPGETEPNEPLQPQVPAPAPPRDNDVQNAEAAEALKKIEMERNMLRKKLDAAEREKAEREQRELEEKEDYRALAEKQKAELEALKRAKADEEAAAAKEAATKAVFADFDPKVVGVAKLTNLSVGDDTDEAKAELKTKLEAIQKEMGLGKPQAPRSTNPVERVGLDDQEEGEFIRRPEGHLDMEDANKRIYLNSKLVKPRLEHAAAKLREEMGFKVHIES